MGRNTRGCWFQTVIRRFGQNAGRSPASSSTVVAGRAEAVAAQGQRSGVRWADALSISVRPVITYWFMTLYCAAKTAAFAAAVTAGAEELTAAQQQITALQEEKQTLESRVEELAAEVNTLQATVAGYKTQVEQLQADIKAANETIEQMKQEPAAEHTKGETEIGRAHV